MNNLSSCYQCKYFENGAVLSRCAKFHKVIKYKNQKPEKHKLCLRSEEKEEIKSEYQEQVDVFKWAESRAEQFPELRFLEGSLNGVRLQLGQVVKAKRAGCIKKDRPDIHLPIMRGGYASLFIELKKKGGEVRDGQKEYLLGLQNYGNYCAICYGADAAISTIIKYLTEKLR